MLAAARRERAIGPISEGLAGSSEDLGVARRAACSAGHPARPPRRRRRGCRRRLLLQPLASVARRDARPRGQLGAVGGPPSASARYRPSRSPR